MITRNLFGMDCISQLLEFLFSISLSYWPSTSRYSTVSTGSFLYSLAPSTPSYCGQWIGSQLRCKSYNIQGPLLFFVENLSDGPRVKLFGQVCKYELGKLVKWCKMWFLVCYLSSGFCWAGPFLEKLPLEKLASLGDDVGKKNSNDSIW